MNKRSRSRAFESRKVTATECDRHWDPVLARPLTPQRCYRAHITWRVNHPGFNNHPINKQGPADHSQVRDRFHDDLVVLSWPMGKRPDHHSVDDCNTTGITLTLGPPSSSSPFLTFLRIIFSV